jgi:mannose-1-phosphate guanylyltransferase
MMNPMSESAGRQIFAVVLAGGSGTRLWPLSRASRPKFLHALTGTADSLLQATVRRVEPLARLAHTYVVTGSHHAAAVSRQLPRIPPDNILVEPSPRDSCAAIGLAAALISLRDGQAIMGSFPADHLIRAEPEFVGVIQAAARGAAQGHLMTIGITPTHAETGYGYLRCGEVTGPGPVRSVKEFREKPSADLAAAYLRGGDYLWNAGMFVWRVDVFLAELRRQQPELYRGVIRIAQEWHGPRQEEVLGEEWPRLPKISVDYAVMEGAADLGLVATVPGDFGWYDIGDFHSLGEVLAATAGRDGNVVLDGLALLHETEGTVVVAGSGRLVATIGVQDLIVVDTEDVVLVCPRDRAQEVKALVDQLRERGQDAYL